MGATQIRIESIISDIFGISLSNTGRGARSFRMRSVADLLASTKSPAAVIILGMTSHSIWSAAYVVTPTPARSSIAMPSVSRSVIRAGIVRIIGAFVTRRTT